MQNTPDDLKYAETHEWVRVNDDGTVTVGITDYAQEKLGDVVFVDTPEPGREVDAGEAVAVVESVKAASDIYSPVTGEVTEVNEALADSPELVNQDPYGDGWLFRIKTSDALDDLLDSSAYAARLEDE